MKVPERFYTDFVSDFPSLATVQDATLSSSLVFGQAALGNLVKYTAWESARRIEAISLPKSAAPAAAALFDNFGSYVAGVASMQTLSVPNVLINTVDNFSAVASALGAFSSAPIVGMVLDFGLTIAEGALAAYSFKHSEDLEAFPMGYDRDRDEDWTRATLKVHAGTDLTSLFLPVNDARDGVGMFNTEVEKRVGKDKVHRQIYVPLGPGTANTGALPNTPNVPKGNEFNLDWNPRTRMHGVPWSQFMPSLSQAVLASWQSLLSNSRACYLVDAVRVADAWRLWQDNMKAWAFGTRYSVDERIRIAMMLNPPVDAATAQRIKDDGYRTLVPFWPGAGMTSKGGVQGSQANMLALLGDVGVWAAQRQLGRRQRKYLGTLTVAYCSENDPAFRSDPGLADLLRARRMLLLSLPDVNAVDLSQVVDAGYRSAVSTRQGPKGLAVPEGGGAGFAGPAGLLGGPQEAAGIPGVPGPQYAGAEPFMGPRAATGGSGAGAALLLLLWGMR